MLVFRSPSFVLERDILRNLLRLVRTAVPFKTAAEVNAVYRDLQDRLRPFERGSYVILMDMRQGPKAPPGSDLEQTISKNLVPLREGWRRIAVLVATPVGMLQANRVEKTTQGNTAVFSDEDAALAYLTSD
jgi:hypothetical protein